MSASGWELWSQKQEPYLGAVAIRMDLQLFADANDKTERATDKKRRDARKKGQVFQSRELSSALLLLAMFFSLKLLGGFIYIEFEKLLRRLLEVYSTYESIDVAVLLKISYDITITFIKTAGPVLIIGFVIGAMMQIVQVGFLFTMDTLIPKFNKINPFSGMKRIVSLNSFVELLKSILKIAIVGAVGYAYLSDQAIPVLQLMAMELKDGATYMIEVSVNLGIRMCLALIALGVMDFMYQWWKYEKDLRMSKKEIKEELKQQEGNPEIKAKIKQKQRQMSLRRMMQDVPKADVVITNPTHFSVALKYDEKKAQAPIVVAKGQDYIALRIREIAKQNGVELVENKPLARAIYNGVEVGEVIPPDLYQAVAEILAYVFSLKNKKIS